MDQNLDETKNDNASSSNTPPVIPSRRTKLTPQTSSIYEKKFTYIMGNTSVKYSTGTKDILGKGSSSIVYPGHHFGKNIPVAVKWIEEQYLRLNIEDLPSELEILQTLGDSVHIIKLVSSFRAINGGLYLALERAQISLQDVITTKKETRENILIWLKQACSGVEFLHSLNIIHRDIKPSNVLLVATRDNKMVAKLSDFGLSKILSGNHLISGTLTCAKGTFPYIAPEMLGTLTDKILAKTSTDIFSLGMTMYFALSNGEYPFKARDDIAMKARILDPDDKPDKLEQDYCPGEDLLWEMLDKKPFNRPTISTVLSHSLFWTLAKKRNFILDVARSFEKSIPGVSKFRAEIDQAFRIRFFKPSWDWLSLLSSNRKFLLTSKSRPNKEKEYGNGDSICELVILYRDKNMHAGDIKTDTDGNNIFTGRLDYFSEEKYMNFFHQLCPSFVDKVYCVVRDHPLLFTGRYYTVDGKSDFSSNKNVTEKDKLVGHFISNTGSVTPINGFSLRIYEVDPISQNYFRGYSDLFLRPSAVYVTSGALQEDKYNNARIWQHLAFDEPSNKYFAPILEIAKTDEKLYVATKLAKATLASELQKGKVNGVYCQNTIVKYLENVVNGVAYLHDRWLVHGKIDKDHILLFGENDQNVAKLCLFNLDQPICAKMDIISIADLIKFCMSSVLTKAQDESSSVSAYVAAESYAWRHLFEWIKQTKSSCSHPTILQVANHPLFWDVQKSFDFISYFPKTLTNQGRYILDQMYAILYKEREGFEFNWASYIDRRFLPPLANGNNLSDLLGFFELPSFQPDGGATFDGTHSKMKFFNQNFPDILIVCFCAALTEGLITHRHRDNTQHFLFYKILNKFSLSKCKCFPSFFSKTSRESLVLNFVNLAL